MDSGEGFEIEVQIGDRGVDLCLEVRPVVAAVGVRVSESVERGAEAEADSIGDAASSLGDYLSAVETSATEAPLISGASLGEALRVMMLIAPASASEP